MRHSLSAVPLQPHGGVSHTIFPSHNADAWRRACSKVLDKFRIGALEDAAPTVSYEQQGSTDRFYEELKSDVNQYFRDNKVRAGGASFAVTCAQW